MSLERPVGGEPADLVGLRALCHCTVIPEDVGGGDTGVALVVVETVEVLVPIEYPCCPGVCLVSDVPRGDFTGVESPGLEDGVGLVHRGDHDVAAGGNGCFPAADIVLTGEYGKAGKGRRR